MTIKKIALIGLGLIGGSIAKALCVDKKNYHIVAFDEDTDTLLKAEKSGWIDEWVSEPELLAKDADIIILCTPVCSMIPLAKKIVPLMKKGAILSDVGSVKGYLKKELSAIMSDDIYYIGAHPMAGSEKSGLDAADVNLFIGRPFVLIPDDNIKNEQMEIMVTFVKDIRAIPVFLDEKTHDLAVAMVSHMPHVLSSVLMLAASDDESALNAKYLAAECFRDMTRVSGADPRMWTDICLTNGDSIIEQLEKFESILQKAKEKIKAGDEKWLMQFFASGREGREQFGMFVTDGKGE